MYQTPSRIERSFRQKKDFFCGVMCILSEVAVLVFLFWAHKNIGKANLVGCCILLELVENCIFRTENIVQNKDTRNYIKGEDTQIRQCLK